MGQNKWKFNKKLYIWNRVRLSLRGKNIIINQLLSKLWYLVYILFQSISKRALKNRIEYTISSRTIKENQTSQTLRHSLDILEIDTQISYLKIKLIQKLLNPTNAVWKNLMLYWWTIDLILNSNQGLTLFKQNRFSGIIDTRPSKNRIMKIYLFSYLMFGYIPWIRNSLHPCL